MPRSLDPAKYPAEYWTLMEMAQVGPIPIPDPNPSGLRGYIQAFLLAVERSNGPLVERAKGCQVTSHKGDPAAIDERRRVPHVLFQRREDSVYAKRVAAALAYSGPKAPALETAAADLAKRLNLEPQS